MFLKLNTSFHCLLHEQLALSGINITMYYNFFMIFGNIDFSSNRISNSEILWISVDLIGLVDIFIYHLVLINVLSILVTSGLISNWHVLLRCLMFLWQLSIVYALSANAFLIELYILVKKKKLGSKLVFLLLHLHFFFFGVFSVSPV